MVKLNILEWNSARSEAGSRLHKKIPAAMFIPCAREVLLCSFFLASTAPSAWREVTSLDAACKIAHRPQTSIAHHCDEAVGGRLVA